MLLQDLESVLAQAQAAFCRPQAKSLMELVGQVADLQVNGHEGRIAAGADCM
jgi:hypothetical protein